MLKIEKMGLEDIYYLSFESGVMTVAFKNISGYVRYDSAIYHYNSDFGGRISKSTAVGKHLKALKYLFRNESTVTDLCVVYENGQRTNKLA